MRQRIAQQIIRLNKCKVNNHSLIQIIEMRVLNRLKRRCSISKAKIKRKKKRLYVDKQHSYETKRGGGSSHVGSLRAEKML